MIPTTTLHPLSKPLIVDVDDVLLNWLLGGFRIHLENVKKIKLNPKGPDSWDLCEWTGLPSDEIFSIIKDFNGSQDFEHLPAFPCAQEVLPRIANSGRNIFVITSCSKDKITHKRRRNNLERVFGPIFQDIVCLDVGESKEPHLKSFAERMGTTGIWVEDNIKNAQQGAAVGHDTFIIRRPHNRHAEQDVKNIRWVDTWHDIQPHLLAA